MEQVSRYKSLKIKDQTATISYFHGTIRNMKFDISKTLIGHRRNESNYELSFAPAREIVVVEQHGRLAAYCLSRIIPVRDFCKTPPVFTRWLPIFIRLGARFSVPDDIVRTNASNEPLENRNGILKNCGVCYNLFAMRWKTELRGTLSVN